MNKKRKFADRLAVKLNTQKGFTLGEVMLALLIMLLASGLVVGCMQMAMRQYHKSLRESEAQILCGSVSNYLETTLQYASNVQSGEAYLMDLIKMERADASYQVWTDPEADFVFFDNAGIMGSGCAVMNGGGVLGGEKGRIYLYSNFPGKGSGKLQPLLSTGNYNYGLGGYVQIQWDVLRQQFEVSVEIRSTEDTGQLFEENTFCVKPLNP